MNRIEIVTVTRFDCQVSPSFMLVMVVAGLITDHAIATLQIIAKVSEMSTRQDLCLLLSIVHYHACRRA